MQALAKCTCIIKICTLKAAQISSSVRQGYPSAHALLLSTSKMRLPTIVIPLALCALQVAGIAVNLAGGLSQSDVLQSLTENPNLLPERCQSATSCDLISTNAP